MIPVEDYEDVATMGFATVSLKYAALSQMKLVEIIDLFDIIDKNKLSYLLLSAKSAVGKKIHASRASALFPLS